MPRRVISKRNILIYRLYNEGYPADVVAKAFSCSVDDVYDAIVIHAIAVDRGPSRRCEIRKALQCKSLSAEIVADYFELSKEQFNDVYDEDGTKESALRKSFLIDYDSLFPAPTIKDLAKRYGIPYGRARKWIADYRREKVLSA